MPSFYSQCYCCHRCGCGPPWLGRGGVLGASRKRTGCGGTGEPRYRLAVFAGVLVSAARLSLVACFNHELKPPAARLDHVGHVDNVDVFPQIWVSCGKTHHCRKNSCLTPHIMRVQLLSTAAIDTKVDSPVPTAMKASGASPSITGIYFENQHCIRLHVRADSKVMPSHSTTFADLIGAPRRPMPGAIATITLLHGKFGATAADELPPLVLLLL